jgi:type I restriction enzyme S subunit
MEFNTDLSALPKGWIWTRVGEIMEVVRGASPRPKGDSRYFGGNIPWIMISDISREKGKYISKTKDTVTEAGKAKSRYLKAGTLILSNSGTVCVPKILAVNGCIHDGFVAFPEVSDEIEILYFYYFFEYVRPKIIQQNKQGVTQVNLNTNIVRNIEILLPPLPEQYRIVNKIEELFTKLDAGVNALKKIKIQLKRYRQAVLKNAFEGKLTQQWREAHQGELEPASVLLEKIKEQRKKEFKGKFKELPPIDTSELSELPEGWVWATFEGIASNDKNAIVDGPFGSNLKVSDYIDDENGIPVLTTKNLEYGYDKQIVRYISRDKFLELKRSEVKGGDILVAKIGSCGKAAIYPENLQSAMIPANLLKMTVYPDINKLYVFYFLNSRFFKKELENITTATAQPAFNVTKFRKLHLPLPPLPEQHQIVSEIERRLSVADLLEKVVEQSLKQAERLRQSILKRAFEGKLVPQDPTDEPAEKLLERIREEKESRSLIKQKSRWKK